MSFVCLCHGTGSVIGRISSIEPLLPWSDGASPSPGGLWIARNSQAAPPPCRCTGAIGRHHWLLRAARGWTSSPPLQPPPRRSSPSRSHCRRPPTAHVFPRLSTCLLVFDKRPRRFRRATSINVARLGTVLLHSRTFFLLATVFAPYTSSIRDFAKERCHPLVPTISPPLATNLCFHFPSA